MSSVVLQLTSGANCNVNASLGVLHDDEHTPNNQKSDCTKLHKSAVAAIPLQVWESVIHLRMAETIPIVAQHFNIM